MTTKKYDLLIVEDTPQEMIAATNAATNFGFKNIATATNLDNALTLYRDTTYIISDLFFPATGAQALNLIETVAPLYQKQSRSANEQINEQKQSSLYRTLVQVVGDDFREKLPQLRKQGFPSEGLYRDIMDFCEEMDELLTYSERCLAAEANVKSGNILPSGIVLGRCAQLSQTPFQIVTSANHHDSYMQPLVHTLHILKLSYVDSYDNGKNWKRGLELLTKRKAN